MLGILLRKHIILENDQYILTLSKEEVLESGISESRYTKVLTDLEKSNAIIAEAIENAKTNSNATIVMSNPSGADYKIQFVDGKRVITYQDKLTVNSIRLKDGNETSNWSLVTTADLDLGCACSKNKASGTFPEGTTKAKFTFEGQVNAVGTVILTVNNSPETMTSLLGELTTTEVNISASRDWKVELTNGFYGTVKVYKK
jgi:hypothetical protein